MRKETKTLLVVIASFGGGFIAGTLATVEIFKAIYHAYPL